MTRAPPPPPPILPPSKILLPLPSPPSRRKKDFHCGANSRFHPRTTLVTREVRGHGGREHTIHSQHERYKPIPPSSPSPASGPVCPTLPLPLPHPLPLPVSDFCLRYRVTHRAQSLRIRHQPLSPSPSTPVNQAPGRGAPLPFRSASLV